MLAFDIDDGELKAIAREFGGTEQQVRMAFGRALRRTASALRRMSSAGLRSELELRTTKHVRRRIREIRLRGGKGGMASVRLWYGANDLPVSAFRGRPTQGPSGARFRGRDYPGAFVAKGKDGKATIFRRRGDGRLPLVEETVPVKDQMDTYLEDVIFDQVGDILARNFRADLRARTSFGVGSQ